VIGPNIKLREFRIEKNWTLRTAAQRMGVSMTVLFNAEQGVIRPRVDHAILIASAYDRSVEDLWSSPLGGPSRCSPAALSPSARSLHICSTKSKTIHGDFAVDNKIPRLVRVLISGQDSGGHLNPTRRSGSSMDRRQEMGISIPQHPGQNLHDTKAPRWKELYLAARLEGDTAKLPQRIDDALYAILDRIADCSLTTSSDLERVALRVALEELHLLRKTAIRRDRN
jgi:transcriptional regulator with XRE-family HTH domain